ncbi:Uncharacterised protein [Burkholderia pseudomallei]|nr:Uncharacterised protein [Burkholderia pseudomallei]
MHFRLSTCTSANVANGKGISWRISQHAIAKQISRKRRLQETSSALVRHVCSCFAFKHDRVGKCQQVCATGLRRHGGGCAPVVGPPGEPQFINAGSNQGSATDLDLVQIGTCDPPPRIIRWRIDAASPVDDAIVEVASIESGTGQLSFKIKTVPARLIINRVKADHSRDKTQNANVVLDFSVFLIDGDIQLINLDTQDGDTNRYLIPCPKIPIDDERANPPTSRREFIRGLSHVLISRNLRNASRCCLPAQSSAGKSSI